MGNKPIGYDFSLGRKYFIDFSPAFAENAKIMSYLCIKF